MFFSGIARFLGLSDPSSETLTPFQYFSHLPVLETKHLRLRPLRMQDAKDIFSYASDPEVARYVLWEPHQSLGDTRAYIRYVRSLYHRGLPSSWAVEELSSSRVIGTIGFMWYSESWQSVELGYSFSRDCWNQGYATEALRVVLDSAFASLPLNRAEAQHDIRNPASGRVMEKCGMRKEGILRQRIRNKGEWVDVALYSVLREERIPG